MLPLILAAALSFLQFRPVATPDIYATPPASETAIGGYTSVTNHAPTAGPVYVPGTETTNPGVRWHIKSTVDGECLALEWETTPEDGPQVVSLGVTEVTKGEDVYGYSALPEVSDFPDGDSWVGVIGRTRGFSLFCSDGQQDAYYKFYRIYFDGIKPA